MARITKLLIANRGEIACRIARSARRLGVGVATVHSGIDRGARHVREVGESYELPGADPTRAYLDIEAIVAAARRAGADAVHPGYGFLSENPRFARAVEDAGLVFVGPTAATMERIGGKAAARREAARLGLPVLAGSEHGSSDAAQVAATVRGMALPVMLKAVAGGGGRGTAVVATLDGLADRIDGAMREAAQAFGDGALIVERYLAHVRHVEVQVAGDGRGGAIHLHERECTLQRRHQKIVEEAPAARLAPAVRAAMLDHACRLAAAVSYRGLGTVEFLVDGDAHYFLEVNPRLQVEHPVTEAVTGLDLVALQLRIADEGRLPLRQDEVRCAGHALEVRVCAEDTDAGSVPVTGTILRARFPGPPVRVEKGVDAGDAVTAHYDSMIAKLVVHGDTRDDALAQMGAALRATSILGVATNLRLLATLLALPETRSSTFFTRLVDERLAQAQAVGAAGPAPPLESLCAAALLALERARRDTPPLGCWSELDGFTGWRLSCGDARPAPTPSLLLGSGGSEAPARFSARGPDGSVRIAIGDTERQVALRESGGGASGTSGTSGTSDGRWLLRCDDRVLELSMHVDGDAIEVDGGGVSHRIVCLPWVGGATQVAPGSGRLVAPMMGRVIAIRAAPGDAVATGQSIVVLESMKMEQHVNAPFAATVVAVRCAIGDMVERGAVLAEVAEVAATDEPAGLAPAPRPIRIRDDEGGRP
jgi:3-methylcrotonyl-CoA carboxylase alpha subunit